MQGFCLCQKNKSSIVCQTKFSCGDTDVKLIKSSCVLHNLLMLMKLEWNISYFDRPFLFYEKKLFSVALKMWSHNAIFHLIFNRLSQVSWLELIAEVVTYDTILQSIFDYNLYSIYLYIYIWEKSLQCHDFHQSRLKIGSTSDFQSTSDLVIPFRLGLSHRAILVESESDEEMWWKMVSCDRTLRMLHM